MPRVKINEKKVEDFMKEAIKKNPSLKKDLELFERVHQAAKKAGLDKMTMKEIDAEIKAAREEARKEREAKEAKEKA